MSWVNLQDCLESITKLKAWRSGKPIPLSFLLVHSFFQLIQWIFLSSLFFPHQYLASKELMVSHMDLGSLKRLMAYVGISCATVLIRTSWPTFDINFSFHPITCLVIFSCKSLKVLTFDLPLVIGRPRYLSLFVIILAPNWCWIILFISGFVFLLKNNDVFWRLITCLDATSYWPRMHNSFDTLLLWLCKIVNCRLQIGDGRCTPHIGST